MTFIVRITEAGGRLHGVVERVTSGRKEHVQTIEDISRVIAAMVLGEERAMSLKGKHALITGGSRGIGRGIALRLAEGGAKVAIHYYTNDGAAKDTLDRVRKHGGDGYIVQADVTRMDDVRRMFAEVKERFGALAPRGITVNAVSPGLTEDSVLNGLPSAVQDASRAWHESGWTPMGRLGTSVDIGNAVALLCSPDSAWITGQCIAVDGGASLMDTVFPLEIQRG